jgi:hypothetical protein
LVWLFSRSIFSCINFDAVDEDAVLGSGHLPVKRKDIVAVEGVVFAIGEHRHIRNMKSDAHCTGTKKARPYRHEPGDGD